MYTELSDYFKALATNHVAINHTDQEKHFFRIDAEEYLVGITTKVNYPFLSLESYDSNFNAPNNDNVAKSRQIAFMLVDKYKQGDYNRMNEIYDELEEVAHDILNRINSDQKQNISLVRDFSFASVNIQSLPPNPAKLYTGVRVTMNFDSKYNTSVNNAKWRDK
jgi:uncharacterized membrane protein